MRRLRAALASRPNPIRNTPPADTRTDRPSTKTLAPGSVVPIIMIISALPIAPAGWGVGDAAFAYFYEAAGTTADLALALSFAYRLTATLLSLLGLPFLLMDRKQVLSVAKEAEGGEELV